MSSNVLERPDLFENEKKKKKFLFSTYLAYNYPCHIDEKRQRRRNERKKNIQKGFRR